MSLVPGNCNQFRYWVHPDLNGPSTRSDTWRGWPCGGRVRLRTVQRGFRAPAASAWFVSRTRVWRNESLPPSVLDTPLVAPGIPLPPATLSMTPQTPPDPCAPCPHPPFYKADVSTPWRPHSRLQRVAP